MQSTHPHKTPQQHMAMVKRHVDKNTLSVGLDRVFSRDGKPIRFYVVARLAMVHSLVKSGAAWNGTRVVVGPLINSNTPDERYEARDEQDSSRCGLFRPENIEQTLDDRETRFVYHIGTRMGISAPFHINAVTHGAIMLGARAAAEQELMSLAESAYLIGDLARSNVTCYTVEIDFSKATVVACMDSIQIAGPTMLAEMNLQAATLPGMGLNVRASGWNPTHQLFEFNHTTPAPEWGSCVICMDRLRENTQVQLACGHIMHLMCIDTWMQGADREEHCCPTCRKPVTQASAIPTDDIIVQKLVGDFISNLPLYQDIVDTRKLVSPRTTTPPTFSDFPGSVWQGGYLLATEHTSLLPRPGQAKGGCFQSGLCKRTVVDKDARLVFVSVCPHGPEHSAELAASERTDYPSTLITALTPPETISLFRRS